MNFKQTVILQCLVISAIIFGVLSLWEFTIIPEIEKIPDDYFRTIEYVAQTTHVDDVHGELKGPFFQRDIQTEKVIEKNGNVLTIEVTVIGKRFDTNEIMFQVSNKYYVDQYTKLHTDVEGMLYEFPSSVEKKDYDFFHPAVFYSDPMKFIGTDNIRGLETYIFETITSDADISRAFPQFAPNVIHTNTTSRLWIEPITGDLVRLEKTWNNYLVENGKNVNTIQTGGKQTSEFTELILTQFVKSKIENIKFNHIIMPVLLIIIILIGSILWILLSYVKKIRNESVKQEKLALVGNLAARIAHDIRNPLSVIKNTVEIMEHKIQSEETSQYLERIKRSTQRISYQVNDVLDYVRADKIIPQKSLLDDIITTSIDRISKPDNTSIIFEKNNLFVECDRIKMETVFVNLLHNAIDSIGREHGTIKIITREEDDKILISIEDTGPGIPEDKIDLIFEPLFTTKQTGTGLGLVSSRSIVESHGGKISVKNNPTTFTIVLPKNIKKQKRNEE